MPDPAYVIDVEQVPAGRAVAAEVAGRWYAVCNDGGTFHVVDFHCPHEGGALAGGEVHDGCIVCPVHHWPWDLRTGLTDPHMPYLRLKRYRCEVRDGRVYADLTAPIPPDLPQP